VVLPPKETATTHCPVNVRMNRIFNHNSPLHLHTCPTPQQLSIHWPSLPMLYPTNTYKPMQSFTVPLHLQASVQSGPLLMPPPQTRVRSLKKAYNSDFGHLTSWSHYLTFLNVVPGWLPMVPTCPEAWSCSKDQSDTVVINFNNRFQIFLNIKYSTTNLKIQSDYKYVHTWITKWINKKC
jgi:hypothetical protein